MLSVLNFFKGLSEQSVRKPQAWTYITSKLRNFSDTPKADSPKVNTNSKQVAVQGPENEEQLRVRRALAADVPRVLRFVREHARSAWPGLAPSPSASHLVLYDYVARALAQGHSMLAEQQEARCVRGKIRGLALNTVQCPWDTAMLDHWARCVRCAHSRRFINFNAHCLRAPALHDKYQVQNILQVTLIIPLDTPKTTEIVNVLVKNSIQRGRDVGVPLIRFDVSDNDLANTLEQLELKKEYQLSYESVLDKIKDDNIATEKVTVDNDSSNTDESKTIKTDSSLPANITVYTSHMFANKD